MIADIEAKEVNCVIVKDLSRFGRDYIDTGKYLERYFPDHDVRFISIMDNIDSRKHAYDMLVPIKNIFNEQYARDISGKVHASIETKQKAGEFIGAFASYGYKKSPTDKNKLMIDEYAAEVVRNIFKLYIGGYGKVRIAGILNKKGVLCPSEYKKVNGENYKNSNRLESTSYWTYSTINRILQNEMYIGNMVQGKRSRQMKGKSRTRKEEEWIVVKNTHPAIIDEVTWKKTRDMLKRRTRNPDFNSNESIFAGFIKCGDCGRALVKKETGNKEIRYYCGTYVRSGRQYCTPHPIPFHILEEIILNDLNMIIQDIRNLHEIVEQSQIVSDSRKPLDDRHTNGLRTELEKVRKLKKAVYEDYRSDLISKKEFTAYRQDYLRKEELLIRQIEAVEQSQTNADISDIKENLWIKRLLEFGKIDKLDREIVAEMLQEIKVYENHTIKIIYNFSGELQHLFQTAFPDKEKNG